MIGAIIGDVVGSRFEFHNYLGKDFDLFAQNSFFTDDTVMSVAVANAILHCRGDYSKLSQETVKKMQCFGQCYPGRGYGGMFIRWLYEENPKPYNSFGNGAAMRISSVGFVAKSIEEAKDLSKKVTEVTHNHPEGLKGAEATAVAIFLAKTGKSKEEIREYINKNYYTLDFTIDSIRETYVYNETCQDSVPQAIEAFLESKDFEDTIRIAVSLGGDSDTLAAIAGSIAEAFYGIPSHILHIGLSFLDDTLRDIVYELDRKFSPHFNKEEYARAAGLHDSEHGEVFTIQRDVNPHRCAYELFPVFNASGTEVGRVDGLALAGSDFYPIISCVFEDETYKEVGFSEFVISNRIPIERDRKNLRNLIARDGFLKIYLSPKMKQLF